MKRLSPATGLAFYLFSLVCLFLLTLLFSLFPVSSQAGHWFSTLSELLVYGLPVALYYGYHPESMDLLRWNPLPLRTGLLLLPAAMTGVYVFNLISLLFSMLLQHLGLTLLAAPIEIPSTRAELIMLLVSAAAAPAVCEELLFRGLLLPALEGRGRKFALFFSGLLFALPHAQIAGLPALVCLGCFLGYLAVRTESLLAPMIYHFCHNAFILIVAFMGAQVSPEAVSATLTVSPMDIFSSIPSFLLFGLFWVLLLRSIFRPFPKSLAPLSVRGGWKYYLLLSLSLLLLGAFVFLNLLPMLPGGAF